jgi:uncharacterized LabA/DUF88 family protein
MCKTQNARREVLVLIDGQNVRQSLYDLGFRGIEFQGLRRWLSGYGRPTIEWFQGEYTQLRGLFNAARASGIRVHGKSPKPIAGGLKADMDVDLCVWAMEHAADYATVVLVSGDGDFAPLVEYLIRAGKRVVVIQSKAVTSPELLQHIDPDDFVDLTLLAEVIGIRRARRPASHQLAGGQAPQPRVAVVPVPAMAG